MLVHPSNPQILNEQWQPLTPIQRVRSLYSYFSEDTILLTSSFGIHSALLLYLIHRERPAQRIYFINTHFHFPETLAYKMELTRLLDLQVEELISVPAIHQLSIRTRMWEKHPDICCRYNKVLPLKPFKDGHRVWISSLMAFQTSYRKHLPFIEGPKQDEKIWRCYPLIDLTEEQFVNYRQQYGLPAHPLETQGYQSAGCLHCTVKGAGRSGRWNGKEKSECGLHLPG